MEDFVPFKLAQKLKEKGFILEKTEIYGKFDSDGLFHSQLYFNYIETMDCDEIIAPTTSQVLKWLREEKKLHIEIFLCIREYSYFIKSIDKIDENGLFHEWLNEDTTDEEHDSYEQAALAGIEYAIDNLI